MTADENFEEWWKTQDPNEMVAVAVKEVARQAYLAATKATAQRCVEICERKWEELARYEAATAIKQEFDL